MSVRTAKFAVEPHTIAVRVANRSEPLFVQVNPRVLGWARESSRISIEDAASHLLVDPQDLEDWEKGIGQPTLEALKNLTSLYKRPLSAFLLGEVPSQPDSPTDFRRSETQHSVPLSTESLLAIRRARFAQEAAEGMVQGLAEQRYAQRQVNVDNPADLASAVRAQLGIDVGIQREWQDSWRAYALWRDSLSAQGVLVLLIPMPEEELRGFAIAGGGQAPVITVNSRETANGRTFTLFHEYCHLLLGAEGAVCKWELNRSIRGVETFCNRFAGEFLVPSGALRQDFIRLGDDEAAADPLRTVSRLAKLYSVSRQVIWYRLWDTGLIKGADFNELWAVFKLPEAKRRGGNAKPGAGKRAARRLSTYGRRFSDLIVSAVDQDVIDTNEALDYLRIHRDEWQEFRDLTRNAIR